VSIFYTGVCRLLGDFNLQDPGLKAVCCYAGSFDVQLQKLRLRTSWLIELSNPHICTMKFNTEEFNTLVRSRRSTFPKQFAAGEPVDETIIRQLLENATWAPNHGRTEPWQFVVFTGEGLQKLSTFQSELYKESAGEKFKEATYENLRANPLKASHVIALCMKRDPNKKFPEIEEIAAVACAVQNIYLTVTAYGVGGYWTTGGVTYNPKAKEFFGLGEDDKLMGFFYVGQIAVPSPEGKRQPVEEKIVWVKD
jgi:nitroreductase